MWAMIQIFEHSGESLSCHDVIRSVWYAHSTYIRREVGWLIHHSGGGFFLGRAKLT